MAEREFDVEVGDRVVLEYTSDPYTRLRPGDEGVIKFIDSLGTLHVEWHDGSSLGLVPGEDRYRVMPRAEDGALAQDRHHVDGMPADVEQMYYGGEQ